MNDYREILIGIFNMIKSKLNLKGISEEKMGKIEFFFSEYKKVIKMINNCEEVNKGLLISIIDKVLQEVMETS